MNRTNTYFYKDKPAFGLDIGFNSLKVMQIVQDKKQQNVTGYGVTNFDPQAIKDGVIVDVEAVAKAAKALFEHQLVGDITTRRVAIAVPASRTYNRIIKLPKLASKELAEAVRLEAEQYIPLPFDQLYLDHTVINQTAKEIELFAVAAPKKMIDSYMALSRLLGLETVAIETTIDSAGRLLVKADRSDVPTILIDFGSRSADITVFDKTLIVTGTVPGGGDELTARISEKLNVSAQEGHIIKTQYGLRYSKKQQQITDALSPALQQLLKEIRRVIRYYEERFGADRKIGQIVTMGGGANMPGLSEYMTDSLRLPVRMSDPWAQIGFSKLQPPNSIERSIYVTVAGIALMNPKELFA
jgi:type IV pilus assembly protein PilM